MRSLHRVAALCSQGRCVIARRPGVLNPAAAVAAATSLALAACGGQATGSAPAAGSGKPGGVLTVGFSVQAPATLDPAKAPQNYAWFEELAYEPLIVHRSDGTLARGRAAPARTCWTRPRQSPGASTPTCRTPPTTTSPRRAGRK